LWKHIRRIPTTAEAKEKDHSDDDGKDEKPVDLKE